MMLSIRDIPLFGAQETNNKNQIRIDTDFVGRFDIERRLGLASAQAFLLNAYTVGLYTQRMIKSSFSPEDFRRVQSFKDDDTIYWNKKIPGAGREWIKTTALMEQAKLQEVLMRDNPEQKFITLLIQLCAQKEDKDAFVNLAKPWLNSDGTVNSRGGRELPTAVGDPDGIIEMGHHFSTVIFTTPQNVLDQAIAERALRFKALRG